MFYIIIITGVGESFGEIALVHRDSFRNATIIADDDADLMVIDQELFDRSLRVSDNNRRLRPGYANISLFKHTQLYLLGWSRKSYNAIKWEKNNVHVI